MPTTISMQLNGSDVAGDWATRSAGMARTTTGPLGARDRRVNCDFADRVVVHLAELRNVVEAIETGVDSANISETRTRFADLRWGAPALYHGMCFAIGNA